MLQRMQHMLQRMQHMLQRMQHMLQRMQHMLQCCGNACADASKRHCTVQAVLPFVHQEQRLPVESRQQQ
jgi:hypothetical protein